MPNIKAGMSKGIKTNLIPERGLIRILANNTPEIAPEAPTALYQESFLCFAYEGSDDNIIPPK